MYSLKWLLLYLHQLRKQREKIMNFNYETTKALIERTTASRELFIIANNIMEQIMKGNCDYEFNALHNTAFQKAKEAKVIERCPAPVDFDNEEMNKLERKAFERCVELSARMDIMPSTRVITNQISKLGYALTAAKQVTNNVAGEGFERMAKMGEVYETSEYFIFRSARHLVAPQVLAKVDALFAERFGWAA